MKPFNLQEALVGKPVCNADGHRITSIDRKSVTAKFNICGVYHSRFGGHNDETHIGAWRPEDLFMASEKKSGWINLYTPNINGDRNYGPGNTVFSSETFARDSATLEGKQTRHVTTIRIEWEE